MLLEQGHECGESLASYPSRALALAAAYDLTASTRCLNGFTLKGLHCLTCDRYHVVYRREVQP
jgi:hypothetical protein